MIYPSIDLNGKMFAIKLYFRNILFANGHFASCHIAPEPMSANYHSQLQQCVNIILTYQTSGTIIVLTDMEEKTHTKSFSRCFAFLASGGSSCAVQSIIGGLEINYVEKTSSGNRIWNSDHVGLPSSSAFLIVDVLEFHLLGFLLRDLLYVSAVLN